MITKPKVKLSNAVLVFVLTCASVWVLSLISDMDVLLYRVGTPTSLYHALFAVGFVFLFQLFRGYRLRVLSDEDLARGPFFQAITLQGVANMLLPIGLGEILLVWILKQHTGSNIQRNVSTVFFARFLDVSVLSIFALLTIALLDVSQSKALTWSTIGFFAATIVLSCILLFVSKRQTRFSSLGKRSWLGRKVRNLFSQFSKNTSHFYTKSIFIRSLAATFAMWSSFFGTYFCVVQAYALPIHFKEILALYTLSFPTNILPIKTAGNVGVFEGVWVLILTTMGWPYEEALEISLVAHLGILAAFITTALLVVAWMTTGYFRSFSDRLC